MAKSKLRVNLIYSILYQILLIIIPLITTPYVSRVLGAEKIGIYSYNNTIAAYFVAFAVLGVANYGNRSIAQAKSDAQLLNKTFSNIYCFQLMTGSIVFCFYLFYVFVVASDRTAALFEGLYVFSALIDLNWLLNGLEEFKFITIRSSIVKIASAALIFAYVKNSEDIYIYIAICCGNFLVSNTLAIPVILQRHIKFIHCKASDVISIWKPMLVLFIPIIGMSIYKYVNKIILTQCSVLEETGFLESSERLLLVPICFVTALGNVMLPKMSASYAQNNEKVANKYLENSFYFAVIAASSMGFGIIAVIKDFVPLFYGEGFEKCETIIPILMISPIFLAIANVIRTQYLIPKGQDKEYVISILFGAVVDIIIALILIPKYAAIGAAIATTVTEFAVCSMQVFLSRKKTIIWRYILKSVPFAIIGAIMCLIVSAISLNVGNIASLVIKVLIGGGIYIALAVWYMYFIKVLQPFKKKMQQ